MKTSRAGDVPTTGALPTGRFLGAAVLLVIEYVVALFFFDSEQLPVGAESNQFGLIGESMPLFIVVLTASVLVGGGWSELEMGEVRAAFADRHPRWPALVAHLLAYALALSITIFVFNSGLELERPWLWIAFWVTSAICSVFFLVPAVVP